MISRKGDPKNTTFVGGAKSTRRKMKNTLSILVLLLVLFVPNFVQSETDQQKKHNVEVRQKLASMFGDFQKSRQKLDEATANLVKIGEEMSDEKANKIWSTIERILYGAVLCRTTSDLLKVAAYVEVDSLPNFFGVLKPHLLQGKGQLDMQYNGLKGYSAFVQDKTALWELDKAKEVMEATLGFYDKANVLLPSEQ
jgi:competence protein ComGC